MSSTPAARSRRKFTVDALFTDHRPQAVGVTELTTAKEIRLDRIEPDPEQPRRTFDEAKLAELAVSIQREGVLQPIAVRYDEARDVYIVLHGERRWRASRLAGLTVIPAIVREVPVERRLIQQLMENIVRDDLNAVDRAAALRALKRQLNDAPWETVAEAVGIRRSRLFQLLGTEKLPAEAQAAIRAGQLSEKQSRALQGLPPGPQAALQAAIVEHDLGAEEAMRLARALRDRGIPDDRDAAAAALTTLRAPAAPPSWAEQLAAVADAATGGRPALAALRQVAAASEAPGFDSRRLEAEVAALAATLTRVPPGALQPGGEAYGPLVALHGTLSALLDQD